MIIVMSSSLAFLFYTTGNMKAVAYSAIFMILVAIWAWRYPGSVDEHTRRVKKGHKIGWIK